MKRNLLLIFASLIAMVFAANASAAYFEGDKMVMVGYVDNDVEVGVELNIDLDTFNFSTASNYTAASSSLDLDQFPTTSNWADVQLGYFGLNSDATNKYFATNSSATPTISRVSIPNFESGAKTTNLTYSQLASGGYPVINSDTGVGYRATMNANGTTPGSYGGLNNQMNTGLTGEISLGDLATIGYVDMYVWQVEGGSRNGQLVQDTAVGVLRLFEDGKVVVNPNAVPIPASILLLGSGLLGVIGIRRRNA
ncbi:MAG: hypothetical protein KJ737_22690 [Proteobacteria bacterium]|nr:hypothetical protein [Pseudomonadota bacterium]